MSKLNDEWYSNGYQDCYNKGAFGILSFFVHFIMEFRYRKSKDLQKIVEVGAGHGQHFMHVKHSFNHYLATDIRYELIPKIKDVRFKSRFADASNLHFIQDSFYDRLIATCLLAHLDEPFTALKEWRRVIRNGGVITIYVPSEPGLLLRVIRKIFIWPKAKKLGLENPELSAYLDHRNHFPMMFALIKSVFVEDSIFRFRFPLSFLPWNLSVFDIYHIKIIK